MKLIGISAGVSYGALGSTHHATHDLAALRAIHNLSIIVPADNLETAEAIKTAADMRPDQIVVINISGRGDKDLEIVEGLV